MSEPVLALRAVAFVSGDRRVLDHVALEIDPGERVAVVGDSGEGKSLLARLAIGLSAPLSGSVRLFGQDLAAIGQDDLRRLRQRCGVAMQGGSLLAGLDVEQNLRMSLLGADGAAATRHARRVTRALLDFGIERAAAADVETLSTGERRRVELARAFLRDPDLVVLDEPLDGARARAADVERALTRQLRASSRALLLLTQDEALATRLATRVLRLERGRLVQQPVPALS